MAVISIVVGVLLLLLGQRLFWLFVGLVGFLVTTDIVAEALAIQPDWLILVIALIVGLVGAVIAVFVQRVAVGVAGFLAGGYFVFSLLPVLGLEMTTAIAWLLAGGGAVLGAVLAVGFLDWALIVLSSLAGASAIVQALDQQFPI